MSKPIVLTYLQWEKLRDRLKADYEPSVLLISSKMKDRLGFTVREYQEWQLDGTRQVRISDIRLDFYNEPKRTMFLLKYTEYLGKTGITNS